MAQRPAEPALSPSSREWLAGSDPLDRKRHGQYLTPRPVAEALLDRVELRPGMRVLDPGVGTGELLAAVARREPEAELTGWDVDAEALAAAGRLVPGATLEQRSALEPACSEPTGADGRSLDSVEVPERPEDPAGYDLILANPPYFQVPVTPELRRRFREVISGRANIFALFFKTGLDLLRPGGTLAYIVPPSMNSGAYFEALREHIVGRATITDLTVLGGSSLFEGANTAAQLLVLRKDAGSCDGPDAGCDRRPFVFERRDDEAGFRRVIFSRNPEELVAGFEGRQTLWQLGYEAVTGTVVWNQHRQALMQQAGPETVPLVWSRDLRDGTLDLEPGPGGQEPVGEGRRKTGPRKPADDKPGFVTGLPALRGPALLVNRVVGAVGRGEIRTALVPEEVEFLAENHVNVVRRRTGAPSVIGWERLQRALGSEGVADRVRALTGNTQISARELTHLLPL